MVKQIAGLLGTDDLSAWEAQFVESVNTNSNGGALTTILTPKQVDVIERIWSKHFA